MGRIVVSENVSLDRVGQDPTGEEGFRYGGWFFQVEDKDREECAKIELNEALGAEALLWVGEATSGSPRRGHPGVASGRTR